MRFQALRTGRTEFSTYFCAVIIQVVCGCKICQILTQNLRSSPLVMPFYRKQNQLQEKNQLEIFKRYLLQIGQVSLHGLFGSEWKLVCLVGYMVTKRLKFCLTFWKTILNLHNFHQTSLQSRLVATVVCNTTFYEYANTWTSAHIMLYVQSSLYENYSLVMQRQTEFFWRYVVAKLHTGHFTTRMHSLKVIIK